MRNDPRRTADPRTAPVAGIAAAAAVAAGATVVAAGTAGMLAGREPFATWYYPIAWYGTLLGLDGAVALRSGRFRLLARPAHLASLLFWSAVAWLFFELVNFRLRNWYYVFVPDDPIARWAGILLSFATVLPAIFVVEALLDSFGAGGGVRTPAFHAGAALRRRLAAAGVVLLALPLVWPSWFFPLVWVGPLLLLEVFTHGRDPARSLLGDLERGRPGRVLRFLAAGAAVGLLWELFNARARGKWIYTVPGFEDLRLFEMPVAGFLGFPPFALECFALWQALVLTGVAVPGPGERPSAADRPDRDDPSAARRPEGANPGARSGPTAGRTRRRRFAAVAAAALFAAGVASGMGRWTISSTTPRLEDLPGVPAAALARAGHDAFSLARSRPEGLATATGRTLAETREWVGTARLATLRGIGTANARALRGVGIASVEDLARAAPDSLAARLARAGGVQAPPVRVRVWIRAARDEVGEPPAVSFRPRDP